MIVELVVVNVRSKLIPNINIYKMTDKKIPFFIQWDSTNACNLSCEHCYHSFEDEDNTQMDLIQTKSMLDNLKETTERWNFKPAFNISGGECTTRKDLNDIIQYSVSNGIETRLLTNGTLINEQRALEFKDLGVSGIQISIDGNETTHNKIRRALWAYNLANRGIQNCSNVGIPTSVSTTLMQQNLGQIAEITEAAIKNGARGIGFQTSSPE